MAQLTRFPIVAAGAWTNKDNALHPDGLYASWGGEALPSHPILQDRLALTGFSGASIAANQTIVGIVIRLRARKRFVGDDLPSSSDDLYVGPTKNGVNPAGNYAVINPTASWQDYAVGTPTHLWGTTWTPADVNSQDFGSMLRFLAGDLFTFCDVDWCVADVFHSQTGESFRMPDALTPLQDCQIGKETTPGTAVACPIKLNKTILEIQPAAEFQKMDHAGHKILGQSHLTREHSRLIVRGELTYDEIGYVLASLLGKPKTQSIGSGAYRHIFTKRARSQDDPQFYTVQVGDEARSRQAANCRITSLEIEAKSDENTISGAGVGAKFSDGIARTAGTNEVQTITLSGTGTIRFIYDGQKTSVIDVSSTSAAAIATALVALTTVGASGFAGSGSGPYVMTAGGALAGQNIQMIDYEIITGSPTVSIAETTRGGLTEIDSEPVVAGAFSVYMADSIAALAANKLVGVSSANINFGEVAKPRFTVDRANNKSLKKIIDQQHEMTIDVLTEANAEGMGLLADARADKTKFVLLEAQGPEISSGVPHEFKITAALNFCDIEDFQDDEGIYAIGYTLGVIFDPAWGAGCRVELVNKVSSY